jgi:hypothetical protein
MSQSQYAQTLVPETEVAMKTRQTVSRLGFWSAMLLGVTALMAFVIAITMAPARSGPFCLPELVDVCVEYPYTDAAAYVPNDYVWMVPATLLSLMFVVVVVALHHAASADRQLFTHVGMAFAVIAATALVIAYFIQLAVMQPSFLKGETDSLSLWSQYNAHGLFIALEDVGYFMMALTFLFIAPVFTGRDRLARSLRYLFRGSGLVVIAALALLTLQYGSDLEYRFEVLSIVVDWLALIIGGGLLCVYFRRAAQ